MANLVTMYEKLYVKGVRVNMDSRDTEKHYAKRQASKPTYHVSENTSGLAIICLIVTAILFGVMIYEIVTELYL